MALKQASLFDLFDSNPEPTPEKAPPVQELNKTPEVSSIEKTQPAAEEPRVLVPPKVVSYEVEEESKEELGENQPTLEKVEEAIEEPETEITIAPFVPEETPLDEKLLEANYATVDFLSDELPKEDTPTPQFSIDPKEKTAVAKERKSTRGRMKLSDMNTVADLIEIPEDAVLFEKRYYSIGAVSEMFKVNISLIRFWENEFDILKPKKNGKGDRHFRPEDVKNLQLIYHLLREKKYTIEGAKEFLKKNKTAEDTFSVIENLKKTKDFLNEIKANL